MSSPRIALILPVAAATLALTGCIGVDAGPTTTQTRDVAAFTRLKAEDEVDVNLRVGEPRHLRVRAGAKVIDDVRTEVRDGTLRVDFDHHGWGGDDVVVEASVKSLTGITADGSGDIEATGIDADGFELQSDGSSDISLAGRARRLTADVDGSGDADLSDLKARDARVSADGSGDVDVRADRLDVTLDGSGDVRYRGNPVLKQSVDGSGDLRRVG
jgi:Putative auto-transporter adhesin, head GIN domain